MVVLDVMLPDINGREVCTRVRSDRTMDAVKIQVHFGDGELDRSTLSVSAVPTFSCKNPLPPTNSLKKYAISWKSIVRQRLARHHFPTLPSFAILSIWACLLAAHSHWKEYHCG